MWGGAPVALTWQRPKEWLRAVQDPLIGTQLGHFQIEEMIAEGGMGVIYKATHAIIGKQAAIKILTDRYSRDKNMIKRLHREARAVNRIGHPNIIDIFDFGQTEDHREYFVMEYVDGKTLARVLIERERLRWSYIEQVLAQTLDALAAIHDLGFIHRDIKPENLLVVEQEGGKMWVKLLDFGIARSMEMGPDGERLTSAGSVMGTPEYVAPEQIRGQDVDGRADLYALGVMLFEMVMGRLPFKGGRSEQIISLLMAHLKEPIPPIGELPPELGIPQFVPAAITKAMAKDPAERFASAREFAAALQIEVGAGGSGSGDYAALTAEQVQAMEQSLDQPAMTAPGTAAPPDMTLETPAPPVTGSLTDAIPTVPMPQQKSSKLRVLAPLAVLAVSGIAIGLFFLLQSFSKAPAATPKAEVTKATPKVAATKKTAPAAAVDLPTTFSRVRQTLQQGLRNPRADIRRICVKGIGEFRSRDDLRLLTAMLKDDPDRSVQSATALAMAYVGDPTAADALRGVHKRSDATLQVWLDDALMRLDQQDGRKRLRAALKADDKGVRFQASLALGEAGDKAAMDVLQGAAREAATLNRQTLIAILGTLARLGHKQAYQSLDKALNSPDRIMKLGAAEALARLGNERALPVLKQMVKGKDATTRLVAGKILASLGDFSGLQQLTAAVTSKDESLRRLAAEGLGRVSDKAAVAPLAAALDDASWLVKATAAKSLARILANMPTALVRRSQDWIKTALDNRDWSVRHAAVGITSEMDPELAVNLLGWALQDKDPRIRSAAVASLGRLRSRKAIPLLAHALVDKSDDVRRKAASALGRLKDAKATAALHNAVRDSSPTVGVAAAGSLLAQGDTSYIADLKRAAKARSAKLRAAAITALGRWVNPAAVVLLKGGLKDPSRKVRFAAAVQLAQRGGKTPAVVAELRKGVGKGAEQRRQALRSLAALGLDAEAELKQLATAKAAQARQASMESAALIPPARALVLLRRGIKDPAPQVRLAAAGSLAKLAPSNRQAAVLLKLATKDPDAAVQVLAAIGLAKVGQGKPRLDMGRVKPVKSAPLPKQKARPKPTVIRPRDRRPLFVEDSDKQKLYKYHVSQAAVATSRGKYRVALKHLKQARRKADQAPLDFEVGFQHLKLGLGQLTTAPKKARKQLKKARAGFKRYLRRDPAGKLAPRAKRGLADVKRLLRQLK